MCKLYCETYRNVKIQKRVGKNKDTRISYYFFTLTIYVHPTLEKSFILINNILFENEVLGAN